MKNTTTVLSIEPKRTFKPIKTTRPRLYAQWVKQNGRLVMHWISE
jgi:hypothetical protein